jgi:hypothetical protein
MKKMNLPLMLFLAASMIVIPALAQIEVHAELEGKGHIKVDGTWYYGEGSVQILFITFSGDVPDHPEGETGKAVLLTIDGESFVWHVTKEKVRANGKIIILKAEPHPLEGTTTPDYPIRVLVRHVPERPLIVIAGRRTAFVAK